MDLTNDLTEHVEEAIAGVVGTKPHGLYITQDHDDHLIVNFPESMKPPYAGRYKEMEAAISSAVPKKYADLKVRVT